MPREAPSARLAPHHLRPRAARRAPGGPVWEILAIPPRPPVETYQVTRRDPHTGRPMTISLWRIRALEGGPAE